MPYITYTLGLLLGSFVNALVWRLHEQGAGYEDEPTGAKSADQRKLQQELSILKGRSMCPHCRHTLAGKDLVPVFSWLYLRGRCRYCHRPISWQYPFVELLTAMLFGLTYIFAASYITTNLPVLVLVYILLVLGVALAVYDAKWFLLPNRLMYPFQIVAGLYAVSVAYVQQDVRVLASASLAALAFYIFFRLIHDVSNGRWLGYGDVRLAIALGLLVGSFTNVLLLVFVASVLGTVVALPQVAQKRSKQRVYIPFGPFLLAAALLVMLWGQAVVDWYIASISA